MLGARETDNPNFAQTWVTIIKHEANQTILSISGVNHNRSGDLHRDQTKTVHTDNITTQSFMKDLEYLFELNYDIN